MDIDRETLMEIVVSTASVLLMIVAMAVIGMNYSENDAITTEGGYVFVGVIVLFVFIMLAVGVWFANYKAKRNGETGGANGA